MDIVKVDPPESHQKKDISNIVKALDSLEERFKTLEINMKSLMLMNEDVTMKLQSSSQKETEQSDLNKFLMEKISQIENEDRPKIAQELKLNINDNILTKLDDIEKRVQVLETGRSAINQNEILNIEKPKDDNIHVLLKFDDKSNFNILERIFNRKKDPLPLHVSKDNDEEIKIFDITWFERNLSIVANKCSEIIMNDLEMLDIVEDVIFNEDIIFTSNPETNLNFKNDSSIIISGNVIFNNLNILGCYFDDKSLIEIKEASKLEFNNGFVENNHGKNSIFFLREKASLILNKTIFDSNVHLLKNNDEPFNYSCIIGKNKSNVHINKCDFMNHSSNDYPNSARLIRISGDLTVISSKFENNKTSIKQKACIFCENGNLNLDDVKVKNCFSIGLINCLSINITNSIFLNNCAVETSGGSLHIRKSQNISIEGSTFNNNETSFSGGALLLCQCKDNNFIKNSMFNENYIKNEDDNVAGGAIGMEESHVTIENSTFYKNEAKHYGGAIYAKKSSKLICSDCTFESNSAKEIGCAISIRKSCSITQPRTNRFISNEAKRDNDIHLEK